MESVFAGIATRITVRRAPATPGRALDTPQDQSPRLSNLENILTIESFSCSALLGIILNNSNIPQGDFFVKTYKYKCQTEITISFYALATLGTVAPP